MKTLLFCLLLAVTTAVSAADPLTIKGGDGEWCLKGFVVGEAGPICIKPPKDGELPKVTKKPPCTGEWVLDGKRCVAVLKPAKL